MHLCIHEVSPNHTCKSCQGVVKWSLPPKENILEHSELNFQKEDKIHSIYTKVQKNVFDSFFFLGINLSKKPKTKLVSRSQGLYHSYSFQMHFIYAPLLAEGTEDSRLHLYKDTDVPPLPITYHLRSQCLDN